MKNPPTVSVCIPTYNRAQMLKESLESVLNQEFEDFELIISDNASEDETSSVVGAFGDWKIRYVRNRRNMGQLHNWNQCLNLARGKYVTILPDDDVMMADNLQAKVELLSRNPHVGLVHSKYHIIDHEGRIVRENTNWGHGADRTSDVVERGHDVLAAMLLTSNMVNAPTVLFRRACYERLGGFTRQLSLAFDWEYWMRIAVHYDIAFLARPLIKWRLHSGTLTSQHVYGGGNTLTLTALREELAAKRLVLKRYHDTIENGRDLKGRAMREKISRIVARGEEMLGDSGPNLEARRFVLDMCWAFPEILLDKRVWKVLLKSILSRSSIETLKRISPI